MKIKKSHLHQVKEKTSGFGLEDKLKENLKKPLLKDNSGGSDNGDLVNDSFVFIFEKNISLKSMRQRT